MQTIAPVENAKGKLWRCVSLCALLSLSACGEYTLIAKEGSEQLIEGQRLRHYRQYDQAEQALEQAYASPDRQVKSEAAFQLAQLAKANERHDETLKYLEQAYAAGYDGSPVRLAKAYMEASPARRDYDKAEKILLRHQYESIDAALNLAKLYIAKEQFDKALPPARLAERMYYRSNSPARDAVQIARIYRDIYLHPAAAHAEAGRSAKQWYSVALKRGDRQDAPVELAQLLMHGVPANSPSYNEGMTLLQTAAARNNLQAMEALGKAFYDAEDNEKALRWFAMREKGGDLDGSQAYHLAKIYKRTKDQPGHAELMERWYGKAIARGNPEARNSWRQYQEEERLKQIVRLEKEREKQLREAERERLRQLATMTPEVEKGYAMLLSAGADKDKAYQHFKALADQNHNLHAMLMVDSWEEKDKENYLYQAIYRQVEPKKLFDAITENASQLGDAHKERIVRQWRLAARYGSAEATYELGQYYKNTQPEQAGQWMARAAELGSGKAMLHKAREMAVNGAGEQTDQQVFAWYRKAAEAGEVEGQYQTGLMYASGKGVAQNLQEAKYWLNQAKNNGYHLASDAITIAEQ